MFDAINEEKQTYVIKASGERELYSDNKLRRSLKRAGASTESVNYVLKLIHSYIRDGITTAEIYKQAFRLLRKRHRQTAANYSIKQALFALGPSGYPFEKLVGALLSASGYKTQVGVVAEGKCVQHEVDVMAQKDEHHIMVECKFHNRRGIKTDVKVALYVQARFEDIKKGYKEDGEHTRIFHEAWLVTNTRLTSDAIRYTQCVGLTAIGWDYPDYSNLQQLIKQNRIYPITMLATLTKTQKEQLVLNGLITCDNIIQNPDSLKEIKMNSRQVERVLSEIDELRSI
jgi:hypothetical protein